jgi:hypothetical protein
MLVADLLQQTRPKLVLTVFQLRMEMCCLLQECVKNNRGTVYDLMASHGDKHNLIKLTIINKDFERVIRHHIHKNNYLEGTNE